MRQMKVALICLLLIGACLQGMDGKTMHVSSSSCCYSFVRKRIPLMKIECYRNISSTCSHSDGVIFRMKAGRRTCASKMEPWVMSYLSQVKSCL